MSAKPCHPLTRQSPIELPLHPTEERLLQVVRTLGHGTLMLKVVAGRPVMIKKPLQDIKLD